MEEKRSQPNRLKRKIDQGIRRTGFDENFVNGVRFHLEVLDSKMEACNIKSQYDCCNLLMSKFFINMIDSYPTRRFKSQVNEHSGWPLPVLPSEVFGQTKCSNEYRKNSFYKCLQVGHILDCRVASVLPNEYHLRVIHKYGITRIWDDLNIIVVMPRNQSELLYLERELFPCDLIRVLVTNINNEDVPKIDVTVSNTEVRPQLGRISEKHLPSYVLDPPEFSSSYSNYLKVLPAFHNPCLFNDIMEGLGLDPRGVYTFYSTCESLKLVDADALLKESHMNDVKYYTEFALQNLQTQSFEKALEYVEKAIQLYPTKRPTSNDKIELYKLYEIRGKIFAAKDQPKISRKALLDWGRAYKTDPSNQQESEHLSEILFIAANKCYKTKDYKKAGKCAEEALKLNKNNTEASALLEHLKARHPEVFFNLDEESLRSLQEKKMELVTELKNIV